MATNESATVQSPEDLRASLAHIEVLQNQIDGMRSALETLVQPLASSRSKTTAQVTRETRESATQAIGKLKDFKQTWESEGTQTIIAKARASASANTDMTLADSVPAYDWASKD